MQRTLLRVPRYLVTATAIAFGVIAGVVLIVRGLHLRGKARVRLGLAIAGLSACDIVFLLTKGNGVGLALLKGGGAGLITVLVLSLWLEFFGVKVYREKDEAE